MMLKIDDLKYSADGLIPAIVADAQTGDVLTLAYMNRESLAISMREGKTCFWSRTRNALWRKGETSGNDQRIVSITADCDRDALLVHVVKSGPACHLGDESCFHEPVFAGEGAPFSLTRLAALIEDRRTKKKEGSYTTYLFEKGIDKILKKVGEESAEVLISAKGGDLANTVYEIADLAYHLMVLMAEMGISVDDVKKELASRHVIDKKVKQEKMK
jgi:phosphoribosyl-ATP pyrophosphohydrolase/phosphoribosyl-AMP cyclohydrolase